jgi:phage terminase large subunit-like protein
VLPPRYAHRLDEYLTELLGFPGSCHDDQVDSTIQALDFLR